MALDIRNLIAAISPDVYCHPSVRKEVKKLVKEKGYAAAAEKAKLVDPNELFDIAEYKLNPNPLKADALKAPYEQHKLVYDSASEGLEPIYFWILDFLNGIFRKVDKLTDNFVSSPGSAHFSEMGMKGSKMQEEAMKILGSVNTVLRSVLNIIYDLKEFRLRIESYNKYRNAKDAAERQANFLSLKQIWLDNVDIKRGNTSIKAMAQQFDYVTLIDAFMAANDLAAVTNPPEQGGIDLNERVRRILQQRLGEFFKWIDESEVELKKRFEIERKYLQSQVNALKLYSRWVRPYLEAARKLEQNLAPTAALVTTFNTILLELSVLAQNEYKPDDDVAVGDLPELFRNIKTRKYFSTVFVELKFRGIPQRVGQGYGFGGRTEVQFLSFSLNDQEIKVLKQEIDNDGFKDTLGLVDGITKDSLEQIEKDINEFLDLKKPESKKGEVESDDTNPFSALFSFFSSDEKKGDEKVDLSKGIKSDDMYERVLRSQSIIGARDLCKTLFETYKKAHQMPAW